MTPNASQDAQQIENHLPARQCGRVVRSPSRNDNTIQIIRNAFQRRKDMHHEFPSLYLPHS